MSHEEFEEPFYLRTCDFKLQGLSKCRILIQSRSFDSGRGLEKPLTPRVAPDLCHSRLCPVSPGTSRDLTLLLHRLVCFPAISRSVVPPPAPLPLSSCQKRDAQGAPLKGQHAPAQPHRQPKCRNVPVLVGKKPVFRTPKALCILVIPALPQTLAPSATGRLEDP